MAKRESKKIVTKKHLARIEREQIQRRYITFATMLIVVIVVALIVAGFIIEGVIKPKQPIAQVNDTIITTELFQSRVRYQRYLYTTEYLNTYQFIQSMGDPNSFSYFESYLLQIQSEMEPEFIGLNTLNDLIDNEFIREEANRLGIKVGEAEVKERINQIIFQYYPDGTPTPEPTEIIIPTPTLSELQMTLVPPTPTEVVTATEETELTATPTDTTGVDTAEEMEPTPTVALPTPTVYTESAYKENYRDFMSYIQSYARISEEDVYDYYESLILREKVSEAVITDIPADEEKLWARHILFRDEETGEQRAKDFLARIKAGEDFGEVAQQIADSAGEDTEEITVRYEDLGWFGEGMMVEPFDLAARSLEVGEISDPIQTSFGWHVIQLLGRDIQPRSQAAIDQLRQGAFEEWLLSKRAEAQVDINPDWTSAVPDEPDIPDQLKITPQGQ
jgi:peptidyl-prolyl cis-trans isomerase D